MLMRAKMRLTSVTRTDNQEVLTFHAVAKSEAYPEDGSDEDNTFALFTPQAEATFTVRNPALFGRFQQGQSYYFDVELTPGQPTE